MIKSLFAVFLVVFFPQTAVSEKLNVAVATNFIGPMTALKDQFEASTNHKLVVSYGSSGKLYAQILHGAPFEVFLSADKEKPQKLIEKKLAVADSQYTYALGRLALWSPHKFPETSLDLLHSKDIRKIAIANPKLAPYGAAALEVLRTTTVNLKQQLVYGENIGQAFQFVKSGNADAGFVAASQLKASPPESPGTVLIISESLHAPIQQDLVLLKKGASNPAAIALHLFFKSDEATSIIRNYGYAVP